MLSLDLSGKTAIVAGSTQGIGLAAAQSLSSLGATCILIARNEEKLKQAVAGLPADNGQQHRYITADFSNTEAVAAAAVQLTAETTIHILVNNSGGPAGGPITEATPEAFLQALQQHLICNQILAQAVLPGMKEAGFGRIINVISTSVKVPLKGLGVSNTTRGAVASWAKTWSMEVAKFGITVNNVLPGATATGRLESIIQNKAGKTGQDTNAVSAEMVSEIPAGRFGAPEEIAAMIAFLATPAAAYVNGTSIPVDGGRTGAI